MKAMRRIRNAVAVSLVLMTALCAMCICASAASGDLSENYEVFQEIRDIRLPGEDWLTGTYYYGLKDKAGNIVIPATYTGMYLFKDCIFAAGTGINYGVVGPGIELPQYGVIDLNQTIILPYQYDSIKPLAATSYTLSKEQYNVYLSDCSTGYLKIEKGGLFGVMTEDYSVLVKPSYYEISYLDDGYFKVSDTHNADANPYYGSSGHMTYSDNKWGVYDSTGKLIIPVAYDEIEYLGDGLFAVEKSNSCGVVNRQNQIIIPLQYAGIEGRYESSFIVSQYTKEEYRQEEKWKAPDWGELWTHQGVVGADNSVLIGFDKYQKITVNSSGKFTCYVWTGGLKESPYYIVGSSYRTYYNVYTYEYVNYDDLGVTVDLADLSTPFDDVAVNAYYFAPVKWAIQNNITSGTSATTFSPDATCTTAQILTFIWHAKGSPEPSADNPFADVKSSDYYCKAALWAYENGLIAGGQFNGNAPCTRGETMRYLWTLAGQPDAGKSSFADAGDYSEAVAWAVQRGITSGTSATTFSPDATCTRAQIMTFLYHDLAQ